MRCAAASFLTGGAPPEGMADACHSSPPRSRRGLYQPVSPSLPLEHSAPLSSGSLGERYASTRPRHSGVADAAFPSASSCPARSSAVDVSGGMPQRMRGGSNVSRCPRPITARQLYGALLERRTTGAAAPTVDTAHGGDVPSERSFAAAAEAPESVGHATPHHLSDAELSCRASARIGESTIVLDGVPCHTVVVCGRVVRCVTAEQNGSAAASLVPPSIPYDLIWISDTTGLLCVLRARQRVSSAMPPEPELGTRLDERYASCFAAPALAQSDMRVPALQGAAPLASEAYMEGGGRRVTQAAAVCAGEASLRASGQPGTLAATSHQHDGSDGGAAADPSTDSDVLYENDYVVCTGVLAFADVDPFVSNAVGSSGGSAASLLRGAMVAALTPREAYIGADSPKEEPRVDPLDESLAAMRAEERRYVLLPGTEVPLRLDVAERELGLVGPLPPQTRYLTEQEAAQWGREGGCGAADAGHRVTDDAEGRAGAPSFSRLAKAEHLDAAPGLRHEKRAARRLPGQGGGEGGGRGGREGGGSVGSARCADVPLVCIKGQPQLLQDSNEALFWWLSAMETHLRLTAAARAAGVQTS